MTTQLMVHHSGRIVLQYEDKEFNHSASVIIDGVRCFDRNEIKELSKVSLELLIFDKI